MGPNNINKNAFILLLECEFHTFYFSTDCKTGSQWVGGFKVVTIHNTHKQKQNKKEKKGKERKG